ncbi:hypothetical protein [Streptomyces anandii]|uniref:hypothetical protein n=1 Tax=Streptomyces anandii TaxID=285454 RepID=UPI001673E83B|nr:hypothetical protein [Streptomyces anandii]GGX91034.1 hypothetical protein GCM10010510_40280 [Streptomyces anandii JCM 4720]
MPDPSTPPRAVRHAQRRRHGADIQRHGLALRFSLIIADSRLADALQVVCQRDEVRVEFPETSVRIGLSRLLSEPRLLSGQGGGLVLHCRASYRSGHPGDPGSRETTRVWQRVLTGRSGAPHQREALLREVLAARSRAPGRVVAHPNPASLRYLAAAV